MRGIRGHLVLAGVVAAGWLADPTQAQQDTPAPRIEGRDEREPSVGRRARIEELILPGTVLQAKPGAPGDAVVMRILAARAHGDGHRYDLEYYALEPGRFDLADYLVRSDGSPAEGLPEIAIQVRPLLPPGQVEPNELAPVAHQTLGGYERLMLVAGILWGLGLLAIVAWGLRRKRVATQAAETPVTLADRLRPILASAQRGDLAGPERAELERLLLAYWRRRLGLREERASHAMTRLRGHAEAGPLLRQLEEWLHRPEPSSTTDLQALLAPYRDVPADFAETAAYEEAGSA